FLGLPEDRRTAFPCHRPSMDVRAAWLQRMLKRPPGALRVLGSPANAQRDGWAAYQPVSSLLGAGHIKHIRKQLLKWNRVKARPFSLTPQLRRDLSNYYRDDVARLSTLLGRDLSPWLESEPG